MSDMAARLLEPGKIITSSNFDSACCCGAAAIADFVFPRISPSGKSVEAEATQVIARPSLQELSETANPGVEQIQLSKRLRKRFDLLIYSRCRRDPAWERALRAGQAADAQAH
jgi:hypothetical protein